MTKNSGARAGVDGQAAIVVGRNRDTMETFIYFIQEGSDGPIKIGYAGWSVVDRLNGLQVGNPRRLSLIGIARGSKGDEKAWHDRFATARIRGEWFGPTQALMRAIRGASLDMTRVVLK